jgi:lysylphosphatidylglycerol synthetase-like protein (DUF2156 family)
MSDTTPANRWRTWLQLLRAPNLFTVPGDPLAGFLLATGGRLDHRLSLAIAASLCFYCHGLLLNDLVDIVEDRRERPTRPLPSRAANVYTVLAVAIGLAVVALALCFAISKSTLLVGLMLLAAIILYNGRSKKIALLGPLNMGLCRGLSLFLGATAGIWEIASPTDALVGARLSALFPIAIAAAIGETLYIAAITHLARIETHADPPRLPRTLPFVTLSLVVVAFFLTAIDHTQPLRYTNVWLYLISACALYAGFKIHSRLTHQPPPPIPPIIGQLIRLLLPLQAIFCLASRSTAGAVSATALFVLWPISKAVSRRFYAS